VAGKVKGSSRYFPYTEIRTNVLLDDPSELAARDKLIATRKEKKIQLSEEVLRIEEFINSIADSELRLIFKYRYIDCLKQREIADILKLERSSISKKISSYLQLSHNSQK
jgi:DNA-directed RNA polymerase specialized sigma24 family protein